MSGRGCGGGYWTSGQCWNCVGLDREYTTHPTPTSHGTLTWRCVGVVAMTSSAHPLPLPSHEAQQPQCHCLCQHQCSVNYCIHFTGHDIKALLLLYPHSMRQVVDYLSKRAFTTDKRPIYQYSTYIPTVLEVFFRISRAPSTHK